MYAAPHVLCVQTKKSRMYLVMRLITALWLILTLIVYQ